MERSDGGVGGEAERESVERSVMGRSVVEASMVVMLCVWEPFLMLASFKSRYRSSGVAC